MRKGLIEEYLNKNDRTIDGMSTLTGVSKEKLDEFNSKSLNEYPMSLIRSLAMYVGKESWVVLEDLELMTAQRDPLLGFRDLLIKYKCTFPLLEIELKQLIDYATTEGIKINNFTFNRFEDEVVDYDNKKEAVETAMENAIEVLNEMLYTEDEEEDYDD